MVPRPGSTTSNDGPTIEEASEAGAQSAGRSPTAREHSERPVASWSSEGTFTTGHGASDDLEGYEEQFAVPDSAPDEGAAKGRDVSRGPTGRKPAKADNQQQPTAKAAAKRKLPKRRKKKKLRAPDSAEASLSKPQGKDAGRQYTVEEVRYVVARTELFRLLEQDPILVFLKPMLMSNFTGPFVAPGFDSLTSVAHAAPILFQMLRDSGFVLGSFEMEKLCDWDLKSWLRAIRVVREPLTILAGSVKQVATSSATGSAQTSTTTPSPPPRYQSSVDFNSSFESRKRKSPEKRCAPDSADGPPVKARGDDTGNQFTAAEMRYMLAGVELIRLLEHDPILRFIKPNAIKFTGPFRVPDFDMLTNVTRAAGTLFEMLHESGFSLGITERTGVYDWDVESWTHTIHGVLGPLTVLVGSIQRKVTPPGTRPISTQMITSPQAESSVDSTSRSKPRRDVDDEPADLFDVDFGMSKTTAATSTTTSPELDEVFNHLSEPPRATPREVTPARIKVLPDLKETIPKALEEASTRSTTTQASNTHVSAVHVEPRNSTRKNSTQKMSTRDASKEMRQQGLGNHAVMSVAVPVATTSRRPLGTARASTTPEQSRYDARVRPVSLDALKRLDPGQTLDVRLRSSRDAPRLWVTRSKTWVTTMFKTKIERQTYLRVTNVTDETIMLDAGTNVGWWTPSDLFPPAPRFVLATNRQYQDWQNLAYEVTCDEDETWRDDELVWPMYGWPTYEDLEFDARRGELEKEVHADRKPTSYPVVAVKSPTAGLTRAPAVETSSVSKLQMRDHSTLSRVVLKTRVDVVTTYTDFEHVTHYTYNRVTAYVEAGTRGPTHLLDAYDEIKKTARRITRRRSGARRRCTAERAKDGADSAKTQVGVTQPTTAQTTSSPSAARVPDPRCTTDSRADARRGTSDGDASAAGAGVFVIQPADHSREDIRPRTLDLETASPVNLVAEDCDAKKLDVENLDAERDAKNRDEGNCDEANPVVNNMDLGRGTAYVLVVTMHSASTRATNPRGRAPGVLQELAAQNPSSLVKTPPRAAKCAESHGPGILRGAVCWTKTRLASDLVVHSSFSHRRLAQVNALEVDQGVHVADRTRGGVATTDTAEVNLPIRYCLDCDSPGLPHELKRMSDALAGCEVQRHECNATGNSSQTRCAETLHHREEIVRKPDSTKHGQCRATDSHAEARRGAMGSALDGARAQGGGNEPAATRNASSPIRRPVAVSKYVEGPTEFEVARSVSDAASDSSRDGTESTRRGICILLNCRLAQVNVLVVGQAGDDANRTRGDVAAMNRAGVNSLMSYCWDRGRMGFAYGLELMLDAVPRDAPCVSTYAVRLETGCTPCQFSVKDVFKLRPVCAMINGTIPSNEPADCRDEMPLEVSRDTSTVKSDGVAYSKVRDKHAETVRVVVDLALSFRFARDRDPRCTSRAIIAVGKLPHQLCTKAQGRPNESRRETSNSLYQLSFNFRTSKQNPVEEFLSHAATCLAVSTNGPFDSTDTCLLEHSLTLALDEDASEGEKSLELHAGRASRPGCARRESDHAGRYRLAAISREDVGRLSRALASDWNCAVTWRVRSTAAAETKAKTMESRPNWEACTRDALIPWLRCTATPDLDEASDLDGASEPDEYPRLTSGGETGAAGAAARLDSTGHSVYLHRDGSFTSTDHVVGVNVPAYGRDDTGKMFSKSIAHVLRRLPTSTRFPKHPSSNRVMLVAVLDGHVVLVLQLDYVSAGTVDLSARGISPLPPHATYSQLRETWPETRRFLQVADTRRAPPEFFGVGHKERVIAPKVY
ncbi:hypothetical protein PHYSODRAFT_339778 [Phytophthora sojae]|uniref:Uncharacterized protein n=1 Tax=Phytophthora sojae (strain P6497) TaxID=1094619 RepID=G5A7K3_PHYSP|nr:hypothetical protein PHYSODRAFT_339778 [Phytophthora sojae]EGZ07879.1 hypothetical protein PHYSODRAFT_339778 [Phytophthora sojae]|eukprot:XP_009536051.1 hypothetical protein PHYSODRAFT_339778 [Phytophthora sojae]